MAVAACALRAVRACPRYRAWAATSPAWFTRISRTDRRRSASSSTNSPRPEAPGNARAARAGAPNTLIALPISPRRRSVGLRLRVLTYTLYYRDPGKRTPHPPRPLAAVEAGLVMWPRVLYTFAPFVGTYRPESFMQ